MHCHKLPSPTLSAVSQLTPQNSGRFHVPKEVSIQIYSAPEVEGRKESLGMRENTSNLEALVRASGLLLPTVLGRRGLLLVPAGVAFHC